MDWLGIDSSQPDIFLRSGDNSALALGVMQFDSTRKAAQATSSSAEAGENAAPAEITAKQNGLLVVSNLSAGENQFTSLAAACAAAPTAT